MKQLMCMATLGLTLALALTGAAAAAETPLTEFGNLVVGQWETDESRHEFEWGVGRKVIRWQSHFKADGQWVLVSEGIWFWDADADAIQGLGVAINMPVDLFRYSTKVQGAEVVHDLVTQGQAGGTYVERWSFKDGEYEWKLQNPTDGATIMGGSYRKLD